MRIVTGLFLVALSVACAKQQPIAQQLSPAQQARCAAITDSVFANVPPEKLPDALPPLERPARLLTPPRSVPVGVPVHVIFLVKPDGSADTSLVSIVGTDDAKYRRDAMNYVLRSHFRPAMSEGCPIWSRVDVAITNMGITREKR